MKKTRNYAVNCQEGIFKLCEINMDISAHEHAYVPSEAKWFSADQNTAKQRFFFTEDGDSRCLESVDSMLCVYEFEDIDSQFQAIHWPITDPERGMVEMIIPDQVLRVGTTNLVQHIYLIQNVEDGPDKWTDVGVVTSTINRSFVDRDMEEMRDFYILRFEDITREIYEIRDQVLQVLGQADVNNIVAQAVDNFLAGNQMPTVEFVLNIQLSLAQHIGDNIRHMNLDDRILINQTSVHLADEETHLVGEDRENFDLSVVHMTDSSMHVSNEERDIIHHLNELHGAITIPDREVTIEDIDGLMEIIDELRERIEELERQ